MFVSFFIPDLPSQQSKIHAFYTQITSFDLSEIFFIAPEYFFLSEDELPKDMNIFSPIAKKFIHRFVIPPKNILDKLMRYTYADSFYKKLIEEFGTINHAFNILQEHFYEDLYDIILNQSLLILKNEKIDAFLSWRGCKSLERVSKELGIPIIHNETGPMRLPKREETFYFDFKGLKTHEDVESRYKKINKNIELTSCMEKYEEVFFPNINLPINGNKSIVLFPNECDYVFTNNHSNFSLLDYAVQKTEHESLLMLRNHPRGDQSRYAKYNYDTSEFIEDSLDNYKMCFTLHSNGGMAFIIRGIPVVFLGGTPLAFLDCRRVSTKREIINRLLFFSLNYLIPRCFLYNKEYYLWRLTQPDEYEIFEKHVGYWDTLLCNKSAEAQVFDAVVA